MILGLPDPHQDPLARGTDLRIRICIQIRRYQNVINPQPCPKGICWKNSETFIIDLWETWPLPVISGVLLVLPHCQVFLLHVDRLKHSSISVYHLENRKIMLKKGYKPWGLIDCVKKNAFPHCALNHCAGGH
jgi:hypothetical protein